MRTSRRLMVGGASAVILAGGVVAAPAPIDEDETGTADSADDPGQPQPNAGPESIDGPVVSNMRGEYQVRLLIDGGVVVDVEFPVAGTSASESRRVNDMALPVLEERILEAQSGDVEYVSGASYTSPAIQESAEAAFAQAGL